MFLLLILYKIISSFPICFFAAAIVAWPASVFSVPNPNVPPCQTFHRLVCTVDLPRIFFPHREIIHLIHTSEFFSGWDVPRNSLLNHSFASIQLAAEINRGSINSGWFIIGKYLKRMRTFTRIYADDNYGQFLIALFIGIWTIAKRCQNAKL